jgi:hypothetical protein
MEVPILLCAGAYLETASGDGVNLAKEREQSGSCVAVMSSVHSLSLSIGRARVPLGGLYGHFCPKNAFGARAH